MIPVKPEIRAGAHIRSMEEYQRLYRLSLDDPEGFWKKQAENITWFHPPSTIFDVDLEEVDFSWYGGGRLNACYNCVDRHLSTQPEKIAIIWAEDEPGEYKHITYRELKHQVARVANVLLAHGVAHGRPGLHLPADDPRAGLHDARLRAHRRRPLGGLRRLLGRVAARPHPRRRLPRWWSPPTRACAAASGSRSRRWSTGAVEGLASIERGAGRPAHRRPRCR